MNWLQSDFRLQLPENDLFRYDVPDAATIPAGAAVISFRTAAEIESERLSRKKRKS